MKLLLILYKKIKKKLSIFHKKILIYKFYIPKVTNKSFNNKPRIIICCDGIFPHGGLIDRLKGIVSFYEVAIKLDYDFFIYFDNPFELTSFLIPNKVNWIISKKDINYNPRTSSILYLMDNFDLNPVELVKSKKSKNIIVYSNVDYLEKINLGKSHQEINTIWRNNFNTLFKESAQLHAAIKKLTQEKRITIHTRFTSLMGDFKDTTSGILNEIEKHDLMLKIIKEIDIIQSLDNNSKIYILSDSIFFLDYIKRNTSYHTLAGSPKHTDIKNNQSNLESHFKTFSDFYFMVNSDEIYLLRLDKMYNSGFSRYASILGNKEFKVITS